MLESPFSPTGRKSASYAIWSLPETGIGAPERVQRLDWIAFSRAGITQSGQSRELGLEGSFNQLRTVRTEHGRMVCWESSAAHMAS